MINAMLLDAFFAAIAAAGFGAISTPPVHTLVWSGIFSAVGHSFRFYLINALGYDLVSSTLAGSFLIGILSLIAAKLYKMPAETFSFPALLPMIPGLVGYKAFLAIIKFLRETDVTLEETYLTEFFSDTLRACSALTAIVLGAFLSVFVDSYSMRLSLKKKA